MPLAVLRKHFSDIVFQNTEQFHVSISEKYRKSTLNIVVYPFRGSISSTKISFQYPRCFAAKPRFYRLRRFFLGYCIYSDIAPNSRSPIRRTYAPLRVRALCEACALASAMGSYNPQTPCVPHSRAHPLRRIRPAMRSCIARRYEWR